MAAHPTQVLQGAPALAKPAPGSKLNLVGHAVAGEVIPRGKSGHHRARTVGNADPGKPAGKCHRKDTAYVPGHT